MSEPSSPALAGFSSILSSLSLPARAKKLRPGSLELSRSDADTLSRGLAAALSPVAIESLLPPIASAKRSSQDSCLILRAPDLSRSPAAAFSWEKFSRAAERAAEIVESLDPSALEPMASALADTLCFPFERAGEPFLAYPAASCGLRPGRSRSPDGKMLPTLAGWSSSFPELLADLAAGRQVRDERLPLDHPVRSDLADLFASPAGAAVRSAAAGESAAAPYQHNASDHRRAFRDGLHLAEPFSRSESDAILPSSRSYEPLPERLRLALSDSSVPLLFARARLRSLDAHAPALVSIALGEACADPLAGRSRAHPALLQWASAAIRASLLTPGGNRYPALPSDPDLVAEYSKGERSAAALADAREFPLSALAQIAGVLVSRIPPYARAHSSEPVWQRLALADDPALPSARLLGKTHPCVASSLRLLLAWESASERIFSRALSIASEREQRWLSSLGFSDAWRHCASSAQDALFSSRDLAWAQATPDLGSAASRSPAEAFLLSLARPLGLSPATPDLPAAASESLIALGATPAGVEALLASAPLREALSRAFSLLSSSKGVAREAARGKLRAALECCSAAAALGPDFRQSASEAASILIDSPDEAAFRSLDQVEPLAPFARSRKVSSPEEAAALREAALAKRQAYPALIRSIVSEHAQARALLGAAPSDPAPAPVLAALSERFSRGLSAFSARVKAGSSEAAPADFDWAEALERGVSWSRACGLPSPSFDASVAAAASDGSPACSIAARIAKDLGLEDASGANDLVARAKSALRERLGMGEAAWRTLLQSPPEDVELFCESLRISRSRIQQIQAPSWVELKRLRGVEASLLDASRTLLAPRVAASAYQAAATFGFPLELSSAALREILFPDVDLRRDYDLRMDIPREAFSALSPSIAPMRLNSPEGADFFLLETRAKAERIPFVWKALFERLRDTRDALLSDPEKLRAAEAAYPPPAPMLAPFAPPPAPGTLAASRPGSSPLELAARSLRSDLQLIADWIDGSEAGFWQALPPKPSWKTLWRGQADWHRERDFAQRQRDEIAIAKGKSPASGNRWGSFSRSFRDGEWEAVDLTSGPDLKVEGEAMSHCVSSYSGQCRSGACRILSVRLAGERVATLQLQPFRGNQPVSWSSADESCEWRIVQNRGRFNAGISDPAALAFCEKARQAYSAAHAEGMRKTRENAAKKRAETVSALAIKVGDEAIPASDAPKAPKARRPRP